MLLSFLGHTLEPACFQVAFQDAPGHHSDGFYTILGWILMTFGIIFDRFRLLLCSSICRMPKPPSTKRNNGKRQAHADNSRLFHQNMIFHMVFIDNTNTYEKSRQEAPIAVWEETSGGRRQKAWREMQEQCNKRNCY